MKRPVWSRYITIVLSTRPRTSWHPWARHTASVPPRGKRSDSMVMLDAQRGTYVTVWTEEAIPHLEAVLAGTKNGIAPVSQV